MRSASNGAPAAHACGRHGMGYWTGIAVASREKPANFGQAVIERRSRLEQGQHQGHCLRLEAIRRPSAQIAESCGHTVPV